MNRDYYFEAPKHKEIFDDIKELIGFGGIYVITGMVGSGKTSLINRMQDYLEKNNNVIMFNSFSIDKKKVNITTLYTALFYDLRPGERAVKIPQSEKRERELTSLTKKKKKSVVFFIDEAHDIHGQTLISLKRVVEIVLRAVCKLSHPKLGNYLNTSSMEEVGARSKIFNITASAADKISFINGWLNKYKIKPTKPSDVMTHEAVQYLAESLQTPLHIENYLNKPVQYAYNVGENQITKEIVQDVLSLDFRTLEVHLRRNGYHSQQVCELLKPTPKELQDFLNNNLNHPLRKEFFKKLASINING